MSFIGLSTLIKGIKSFIWKIVIIFLKILITVILFFLYFLGFGIMYGLAVFFRRSVLLRVNSRLSTWRVKPEN